ncbi:MAG: hypothetical protein KDB26_13185, partial [Microthrixaceae bacterium]|nr:hypothetical protein [Microthrixaceae bacterium]
MRLLVAGCHQLPPPPPPPPDPPENPPPPPLLDCEAAYAEAALEIVELNESLMDVIEYLLGEPVQINHGTTGGSTPWSL